MKRKTENAKSLNNYYINQPFLQMSMNILKTTTFIVSGLLLFATASGQPVRKIGNTTPDYRPATIKPASSRTGTLPFYAFTRNASDALQADFSIQSSSSADITWSENFDAGTEGWTFTNEPIIEDDIPTLMWERNADLQPASHKFSTVEQNDIASLHVEGSFRMYERAIAYATSPAIALPSNAMLRFYLGYSLNFSKECNLSLEISENNGEEWTEIWNTAQGETQDKPWKWRKVEKDLAPYAGKTVLLRWKYSGYMGDFALDGITISGVKTIEEVAVKTGEKIQFIDLSAGEPDTWKWDFPGGTPSASTEANPIVYYTVDGNYDISLTVSKNGQNSSVTKTGFVKVTGEKPVASILPPASFRDYLTHNPFIAPVVPVRYKDNSENYPTELTWRIEGVLENASDVFVSEEPEPEVRYWFSGNELETSLFTQNQHGISETSLKVTVNKYGGSWITNLQADDAPFTFDMDGESSFPGTNKYRITEYAEKFSKPAVPMSIGAVHLYFNTVRADELYEQLQNITVRVCKSENGIPGESLDFASWMLFELDGQLVANEFAFTEQVVVDDEFFIVISGFPEKSDIVDVQMATARFRSQGNTAYFKQDGVWKAASDYFPAGQNHTSYWLDVSAQYSTLCFYEDQKSDTYEVPESAGILEIPIYTLFAYTPALESDWCRLVGEPNGLSLDTLRIAYDALPPAGGIRTATVTITDGMNTITTQIKQQGGSGVECMKPSYQEGYLRPSAFENECEVILPEKCTRITVTDISGKIILDRPLTGRTENFMLPAGNWKSGLYLIRLATPEGNTVLKGIRK